MDQQGRIRKYWHNQLSEQEKLAFEAEMKADAELAQEVQHFRDLQRAIEAHDRQTLKEQLATLPVNRPRPKLWPWAAAAAVLLLLVMAWFYRVSATTTPEQLFATYYEPYPNVVHPIVRQQNTADSLTLAFSAYEQGNYPEAAQRLEELLAIDDQPIWRFYLAQSQLSLGQYEAAKAQLRRLPATSFRFRAQALWYQALLSLQEGNTVAAKDFLTELRQFDPVFKQEAVETLLRDLSAD